jgi:hypothetical protein
MKKYLFYYYYVRYGEETTKGNDWRFIDANNKMEAMNILKNQINTYDLVDITILSITELTIEEFELWKKICYHY